MLLVNLGLLINYMMCVCASKYGKVLKLTLKLPHRVKFGQKSKCFEILVLYMSNLTNFPYIDVSTQHINNQHTKLTKNSSSLGMSFSIDPFDLCHCGSQIMDYKFLATYFLHIKPFSLPLPPHTHTQTEQFFWLPVRRVCN